MVMQTHRSDYSVRVIQTSLFEPPIPTIRDTYKADQSLYATTPASGDQGQVRIDSALLLE